MAPLEKSDGHLLLNNDSKEGDGAEFNDGPTTHPADGSACESNILYTVALLAMFTSYSQILFFCHWRLKCRVKQREQAWEPRPSELTSMKLTVSTAPPLSCLLCDGAKPDIFVQRWQNVHLLTKCVQQMQESSNVERQRQVGTLPQRELGGWWTANVAFNYSPPSSGSHCYIVCKSVRVRYLVGTLESWSGITRTILSAAYASFKIATEDRSNHNISGNTRNVTNVS